MPTLDLDLVDAGRRIGPIPRYGSAEYLALDRDDPRRIASMALAARSWLDYCRPESVRLELDMRLEADRLVAEEAERVWARQLCAWLTKPTPVGYIARSRREQAAAA